MRITKCIVRESLSGLETMMHMFLKTDTEYSVWSVYHIALGEPWFTPNRKVENYRLRERFDGKFTYYGYCADWCTTIQEVEAGVAL